MKLYRGLKTSQFKPYTKDIESQVRSTWASLLMRRAQNDRNYPKDLDAEILVLEKLLRLQRQHFTDNKEIALSYAKSNGGMLLEIDVPLADLIDHFRLEFQNFGKRKTSFEIVYVVEASRLYKNRRKWKLRESFFQG